MKLKEISEKFSLNSEEQAIFTEYTRNRFTGIEEITAPDSGFLAMWEKIVSYAKIVGADKAINQKICPKHPVSWSSPDTLDIRIYDSFAGKIPIISACHEYRIQGHTPGRYRKNGSIIHIRQNNTLHHPFRKAVQQCSGIGAWIEQ